eukprot:313777-Hanusia_phi.AAC.1
MFQAQHSPTDHHMGDLELSQLRSGAWQGHILDFSMSHVFNTDGTRDPSASSYGQHPMWSQSAKGPRLNFG